MKLLAKALSLSNQTGSAETLIISTVVQDATCNCCSTNGTDAIFKTMNFLIFSYEIDLTFCLCSIVVRSVVTFWYASCHFKLTFCLTGCSNETTGVLLENPGPEFVPDAVFRFLYEQLFKRENSISKGRVMKSFASNFQWHKSNKLQSTASCLKFQNNHIKHVGNNFNYW